MEDYEITNTFLDGYEMTSLMVTNWPILSVTKWQGYEMTGSQHFESDIARKSWNEFQV